MFAVLFRRLCILAMIISIAGCGSSGQSKSNVKSYPQDGYMGITSVGPNNPMNPTYHHYRDDTNLMKAVLGQYPDVKASWITIKGPVAHVRLQFQEGLNAARVDRVRSAVQQALSTNMPRYSVRVYTQNE
jgi:hypothetical protein